MSKADATFIYIGTYNSEYLAQADFETVRDLHALGAVGTYDAAVVTKDGFGKVHVQKNEMATRHGGWGGVAVGAVVGILFPPSIVGTVIVGGAVGAFGGHLWGGMSRTDVKDFGEVLDIGEAALIVVGESKIEEELNKVGLKAERQIARDFDVNPRDLDQAIKDAASEIAA